MKATFVVIGGGIAGVSCVESLRILSPDTSIILISATSVVKVVTNITPLTNLTAEFRIEEKSHEHLSRTNEHLTVVVDTVISINPDKRTLKTGQNRKVSYDYLCLCTGAVPKVVIPDNDYIIGIRDTDSAIKLQQKLESSRRVVIIGNGGIATEVVYEMKGVEIIWVIKDKHISATFVDPGAAQFFQDSMNDKKDEGTTGNTTDRESRQHRVYKRLKYSDLSSSDVCKSFMPGAALGPDWHDNIKLAGICPNGKLTIEYDTELECISPSEVNPDDGDHDGDSNSNRGKEKWPIYVTLTNGKTYGCDFVISATGVKPNSGRIRLENGPGFNLAADGGINVNWEMKTNVDRIYAAGDVCTANWDKAPHWIQMRLWTQARQMGCYAAKSMISACNGERLLQDFCFEMFTHVTRFFGYKVVLLGLFNGQTLADKLYELMVRVTKGDEYVKLVLLNGHLQGAVLVGETDLEEMCENLILNQLDLTEYGTDLLNPDIDVDDYFD